MKFISWNVNGLRACITKGFYDFVKFEDPDFMCVQETKMKEGQAVIELDGYYSYFNDAIKAGYSGTLILTKHQPNFIHNGLIDGKYNDEGRVITLEYNDFYLVTVYTPNSQNELKRLDYRMVFEDDFKEYLVSLKSKKDVIVCGDLNVAHSVLDIKNPKSNERNAGYTIEERTKLTELLASGFIDSFRYLYPAEIKYSWWSYRFSARDRNIGWRIDYFLVSAGLEGKIKNAKIHTDILGSDHCPVSLEI